ncbi:helix-turn-helix domain-containing protein [Celeribacter neptunius]|uniref:helix-turn-helix domain-containing protein n=1 Tax=Celeribacter neptunius TaxID=588602 RepID=UPI000A91F6B2|nr:helix-turn-helix transcriptional regulator [Celeribacter neptunius]
MFGENLRRLAADAQSVSQLCRELGVNRTQFNRYLHAEAFPRPDVLDRICSYFDVDARILLEPLDALREPCRQTGALRELTSLLSGVGALEVPEDILPSGVYLYRRVSSFNPGAIHCSMFALSRDELDVARIRGYTPVDASTRIGLGRKPGKRRFRGLVFRQLLGFSFVISMEQTSIMVLGGFESRYLGNPKFYFGTSLSTQDVLIPSPILLERLEPDCAAVMAARCALGMHERAELSPLLRGYFDRYAPLS